MSRGIAGHPGHCNKKRKYNLSFKVKPISEKERKRLVRERKKNRQRERKGEHANNYKPNTVKYTGYVTKQVNIDWKKVKFNKFSVYINPLTNACVWDYDDFKVPSPITRYVQESAAELANIGLAEKVVARQFNDDKK